jgi:hypothetical protein
MLLAVGGFMVLSFLLVGALPSMASQRWVYGIGCVSGVVVGTCGYFMRKRIAGPEVFST